MASFNGTPFLGPMFNQNFFQNNFNNNPRMERPPMQPFHRMPNPPFRPYQSPEMFRRGNFVNAPRFSNFPNPMFSTGFGGRQPSPLNVTPLNANSSSHSFTHTAHSIPRPRFSGNFEQPFRPWNQSSSFVPPRPPFQNLHRATRPSHPKSIPSQQPKRRKEKTREFKKLKSWMTDELFAEVKKKNALYLKAKSSDEQTAWQEFRLQRNRVSSLIKEAKIKAGLISRKIKEDDKTEKPFSCDTCDRAFVTESELKEHLSLHIKCDHVNCRFEAHPKIVFLHKKMQHDTGYADTINKLQNDAEIEKWREERRRRFPTTENVKKRQAEQAEKAARGEVLETKEFGKFKRPRTDNGDVRNQDKRRRTRGNRNQKNFNERRNQYHPNSRPIINVNLDSESDSDNDSHISLNKFAGMSSLTNSAIENLNENEVTSSNINDDNDNLQSPPEIEQNLPKTNPDESVIILEVPEDDKLNNPAEKTILLSDDTFEDESVQQHSESPIVPVSVTAIEVQGEPLSSTKQPMDCDSTDKNSENKNQTHNVQGEPLSSTKQPMDCDSTDKNSENKNQTHNAQEELPSTKEPMNDGSTDINAGNKNQAQKDSSNRHQRQQHNRFDGKQDPTFGVRKSTLLEKFLADDIRHERNLILQCIRHIVNNNFFGIGGNK